MFVSACGIAWNLRFCSNEWCRHKFSGEPWLTVFIRRVCMLSCKNLPSPWSWGTPVIQLDLPPWCYLVHQLAPSLGPHCSTAEPLYALYSSISPVSCSFLIFIGLWRALAVQPVSVMVWFCCCCHITAYIALTSSSVSLLLFGVHFWALFGVWWSGQFALDFKHCPGPPVAQLGVTGLSQTSNRMASTHF